MYVPKYKRLFLTKVDHFWRVVTRRAVRTELIFNDNQPPLSGRLCSENSALSPPLPPLPLDPRAVTATRTAHTSTAGDEDRLVRAAPIRRFQ